MSACQLVAATSNALASPATRGYLLTCACKPPLEGCNHNSSATAPPDTGIRLLLLKHPKSALAPQNQPLNKSGFPWLKVMRKEGSTLQQPQRQTLTKSDSAWLWAALRWAALRWAALQWAALQWAALQGGAVYRAVSRTAAISEPVAHRDRFDVAPQGAGSPKPGIPLYIPWPAPHSERCDLA